jgi:thermitase
MPGWPPGQFGGGLVNADRLLAAPLPDGTTEPIMVAAPEGHAPVSRGGIITFSHLFDEAMRADLGVRNMPTADEPIDSRARLNATLSTLMNTTEGALPADLGQVGQELAFYLATDPILYRRFAEAVSPHGSGPSQAEGVAAFDTSAPASQNIEEVRQQLLLKGVSPALAAKLRKQ